LIQFLVFTTTGTTETPTPSLFGFGVFLFEGGLFMKLNGEIFTLSAPVALQTLLEEHGYHSIRIAVERNGEIVPKSEYPSTMISDDDVLEVVSFVGGG
jgi:sulfur carrier protein